MKKLLLISLIFLHGCAMMSNRTHPQNLNLNDLPTQSSIIVLSTWAPETCTSTSTFLKVMPVTEKYNGSEVALLNIDNSYVKSDFPNNAGHIHALAIPAGDYYLTPMIANPYVKAQKMPKADFSIKAGEIVYLGEYHMHNSCALSFTASFNDEYQRDMTMLTERNAQFKNVTVESHVVTYSGYAELPKY